MPLVPRPRAKTENDLPDDAEIEGGATQTISAQMMTELGGLTPTGQTVAPPSGRTDVATQKRKRLDPLDEPTLAVPPRLAIGPVTNTNRRPRASSAPPAPSAAPRPSQNLRAEQPTAAVPRRATTNNVIPRASLEDTKPNLRPAPPSQRTEQLEQTRPRSTMHPPKRLLGGYRISGVLASGQMGVVYRGEHPVHRRAPVAIKSVQGELQSNPAAVARFFAESIVLARINHPNVVRFHDFGYDAEGSAYLVMELLEGETLTARLAREGRLDIPTATDIALQVAQGLAAAHAQGVIHRDVKPDNIFLCTDGTVKLLDFGVAKLEGHGPTHTLQGDLLGTAAYMAPEQGRSASESDARSDLYSIGCILFEMVCGVVPFPGSLVETLVAHQTAERPPARALNRDVSTELDAIIDRLLARDPAARPQTAVDVIKALAHLESTAVRPVRRPHRFGRHCMRARIESVIARVRNEPIALGLLVTVIVLMIALIVRH